MIELAIWYLRKRKIQIIMGIEFLESTTVKNKNDTLYVYDIKGSSLNILNKL